MATTSESLEIQEVGKQWAYLNSLITSGKYTEEQVKMWKQEQQSLHEKAERLRAELGYSGGEDGSKVVPISDKTNNIIDKITIPEGNLNSGLTASGVTGLPFIIIGILVVFAVLRG